MAHSRGFIAPRRWRSAVLVLALLVALPPGIAATAAAQEAPRPVCVAGETPGDRINAIIGVLIGHFTLSSILASGLAVDPSDSNGNTLYDLCPGVAVLQHFDRGYLPPLLGLLAIDVWEHALKGESLAEIGEAQGVSREALIEALQSGYSEALDKALAADEITDTQRQRLADRILPNFAWIVDWSANDAALVAAGDIDGDGQFAGTIDALPGNTDVERSENAIRLLLGLPVTGLDLTDPVAVDTPNGEIWKTLSEAAVAALVPDGALPPDEIYAEYLAGKSLLDIHTEHGGNPATLTETLLAALNQALDGAVASGDLTTGDRDRLEPILASTVAGTVKHRIGVPLPSEFMGGGGDDDAAGAAAVAAPSCQGVPATFVASGPNQVTSGGPWADVILGTTGDDVLYGNGGSDLICGLGGEDTIEGNQGSDALYGGAGGDLIYGEAGALVLSGGGDTIYGGGGNDVLVGQAGGDTISGEGGADELDGGDGGDVLDGGDGDDDLDGGSGGDSCIGGNGVDTLSQC